LTRDEARLVLANKLGDYMGLIWLVRTLAIALMGKLLSEMGRKALGVRVESFLRSKVRWSLLILVLSVLWSKKSEESLKIEVLVADQNFL
jgi:hypothetical protein